MKALLSLLALAAAGAQAAPYKLTLIVPADDPRLDRTRVERAYFGHPTCPVAEGLAMALRDAKLELDAAGTDLTLDVVAVASAADAAKAAAKAEKAGHAALVTDLSAEATLAVADAGQAAGAQRRQCREPPAREGLPGPPVPPAAQRAHARRLAGPGPGHLALEPGAAADRP